MIRKNGFLFIKTCLILFYQNETIGQHFRLDFFALPSGLKNAEPRAKASSL